MNPVNIKNYRDIDLTKLNFNHPKKTRGGSYISLITYGDNNEKIFIQTPKITTTTGICNHESRSYIELEFDKNHLSFYDFLISLDETNIKVVNSNSKEWFEQTLPLDIIDEFYKPNIKIRKNLAPKIKFKIPVNKGDVLCNIYNDSHQLINSSDINENDKVVLIIELIGLKFLKQQFNLEWKVSQIKLYQNVNINKCMINDNYLSDNQYSDDEIDNELDKLEKSFTNELEYNIDNEKQFNITNEYSNYDNQNSDNEDNEDNEENENLNNEYGIHNPESNNSEYNDNSGNNNSGNNNSGIKSENNINLEINSKPSDSEKNTTNSSKKVTFSDDYDSDYSDYSDNLGEFIDLIEKPTEGVEEISFEQKDNTPNNDNTTENVNNAEFKNNDIDKMDYKKILESTQEELNKYKDKYENEVKKLENIKKKYNKIWE